MTCFMFKNGFGLITYNGWCAIKPNQINPTIYLSVHLHLSIYLPPVEGWTGRQVARVGRSGTKNLWFRSKTINLLFVHSFIYFFPCFFFSVLFSGWWWVNPFLKITLPKINPPSLVNLIKKQKKKKKRKRKKKNKNTSPYPNADRKNGKIIRYRRTNISFKTLNDYISRSYKENQDNTDDDDDYDCYSDDIDIKSATPCWTLIIERNVASS